MKPALLAVAMVAVYLFFGVLAVAVVLVAGSEILKMLK